MTRPRRIPARRGDVTAATVAELLGLSLAGLEARRTDPAARDLPVGKYCVAARPEDAVP